MADNSNIRTFTALDIEKYHKGLLSSKERHALEKAALDDPFLADALEGYAVAGTDATANIAGLKKRLSERIERGKIVPIEQGSGKTSFPWLRVAAMLVLVAGAALLANQFFFNRDKKEIEIAKVEQPASKSENILKQDSAAPADSMVKENNFATVKPSQLQQAGSGSVSPLSDAAASTEAPIVQNDAFKSDTTIVAYAYKPGAVKIAEERKTDDKASAEEGKNKDLAGVVADRKSTKEGDKKEETRKDTEREKLSEIASADDLAKRKVAAGNRSQYNDNYTANTFRGRVVDNNNNAVPFANVTNVQDNVGTYTDARGFFNLTSSADTILNVQVKGLGYNNNLSQLRNNVPFNQVVMQEDRSVAAQTLSEKKINYERRSRDANMKLEGEPEPEDGWENYDSYLTNNLNIPDEALRAKQTGGGSVDVSFEVNKNGEPVNFKIEKSLCAKCDQEAIRLIKEGPKWKRKARKGRTTVTISF